MDLVYNEGLIELRSHPKKRMIVGRSFSLKEDHLLQVAWDPVSPCRDLIPLACTQICKEIENEGLQWSPQGSRDQEGACKTIKR